MSFPLSSAAASRLRVLPEVGSTNDALAAIAADEPDFSVMLTTHQSAGRGRLGRVWVAAPGKTLAVSVLLRPVMASGAALPLERFGWFPLIAGAAMSAAVATVVDPARVVLKWPNDIQVDRLKVSGLLAELLPATGAVVLGAGLNLTQTADELPVPTATSLALASATTQSGAVSGEELADAVLAEYLTRLRVLVDRYLGAEGDAEGSGIRSIVSDACTTLGQDVRVHLPGGGDLRGVAVAIDADGRLLVKTPADDAETAVAAGDVTHLRYE